MRAGPEAVAGFEAAMRKSDPGVVMPYSPGSVSNTRMGTRGAALTGPTAVAIHPTSNGLAVWLSEKRAWVLLVTMLRVKVGRTTEAPVKSFDEVVKTERMSAVESAVMAGMAAAASARKVVLIVVFVREWWWSEGGGGDVRGSG